VHGNVHVSFLLYHFKIKDDIAAWKRIASNKMLLKRQCRIVLCPSPDLSPQGRLPWIATPSEKWLAMTKAKLDSGLRRNDRVKEERRAEFTL